jgi:hypothetical protein
VFVGICGGARGGCAGLRGSARDEATGRAVELNIFFLFSSLHAGLCSLSAVRTNNKKNLETKEKKKIAPRAAKVRNRC